MTIDDNTVESTEVWYFIVSGLSASEATIDPSTPAAGTQLGVPYWFPRIQDNDNPGNPNITIAPGPSPVTEGTGATFTVTATPAPTAAKAVTLSVSEDTSGGRDYVASTAEGTKSVTIPAAGSTNAGVATYTVPTVADGTDEPDGTVTVSVSSGSGYTVGSPSSASVTVTDDAPTQQATLSIAAPADAAEGDSGTRSLNFTVRLSRAVTGAIGYKVCFGGTATLGTGAGADYRVAGATGSPPCLSLSLSAGAHTQTFPIQVAGDTAVEPNETVVATLSFVGSPPAGVTLGTSTATHTIVDDDGDVTVSMGAASVTVEEGEVAYVPVVLDRARTVPTVVTLYVTGSTATRQVDFSSDLSMRVTIPAGKTRAFARIQTTEDSRLETDELFGVSIHTASLPAGVTAGSQTATNVTIDEDEYTVAFVDTIRTVSEKAGVAELGLTVNPAQSRDLKVYFSYSTDLGASATDYTAVHDPAERALTIPAGDTTATLAVPVTWDTDTGEGNELLQIRAIPPALPHGREYGSINVIIAYTTDAPPAAGAAPEVSVAVLGADAVTEGAPARFRLTSDPAPALPYVVAVHVSEAGRERRPSHEDYVGHVAEGDLGFKRIVMPASGQVDFSVATAAQSAVERDTRVRVQVVRPLPGVADAAGGGLGDYRPPRAGKPAPASEDAEVTVRDGPDTAAARTPEVTVRPVSLEVAEGEDAVFWLIAEPAPAADLTVNLAVEGWNGILRDGEGERTVVIPAGKPWQRGSADLRLRTVKDNDADGTRDRVTVTVKAGSGYTVGDLRDFAGGPPYRLGSYQATVTVVDAGSGAPPVAPTAAPDTPVGNVRIAALDAERAQATWDAVPRASAYLVEWEVRGTGANYAGADFGVTETSLVIAHGASDAETISVRVVPWHTGGDGQARLLHALAGTATLVLTLPGNAPVRGQSGDELSAGPGTAAEADPAVVAMVEAMIVRHRDVTGNAGALAKWEKALRTLKGEPGGFTIAELEARVAGLSGTPRERWQRVLDAVRAMQGTGNGAAPAITVTAGSAVTEGTAASFTLAADPAPKADLAVTVSVGQTGAYVASGNRGARTVTIAAGEASAGFTVATRGDGKDEPDGAVVATVESGTGYTVGDPGSGSGAGTATANVAVRDDDATGVALSAEAGDIAEDSGRKLLRIALGRTLVAGETLTVPLVLGGTAALGADYTLRLKGSRKGVSHANLASTDPATTPAAIFAGPSAKFATLVLAATADNANEGESETVTVGLGALKPAGMGGGAEGSGTVAFAILEPPPEVSIVAKTASVTEGADAAFTVTASRAPAQDMTVNLTVSEADGSDMVAAENEGAATVTIPKGKTEAEFTVPTVNDAQDEPDGTVTATLAGDGEDGTLYAASLAFDPDPATKRGPSLTLRQDWGGQATGGLGALFAPNPLEKRIGGGEPTSRWQAEAAWGFPAFGDRFTASPHVGLGLATGTRDWTLGWRLTPAAANANAPDLSLGLKATRRESDTAEPEHTVGFEATVRW